MSRGGKSEGLRRRAGFESQSQRMQGSKRLRSQVGDFPAGPVVKNLPCNVRGMGSIRVQGATIPHGSEQLSLRAVIRDPTCHNKRSHNGH